MIHLTSLSISITFSLGETDLFLTISFGEVNLYLGDIILYLGELGPPLRKTSLTRETCSSPTFSLGEVKLHAIFSIGEKNLPFGGVILSYGRNLLLLRGTTLSPYPPLGNLSSALPLEKTSLSAFILITVTFPTALSFRRVKRLLPLGEKALFLEEHSLNLLASFTLGLVSLPHGVLALYKAFSLRGMNLSLGEFILPFWESLISLENRLCCSIPCCIPFTEFLHDGGFIQTANHSFFNLLTRIRQYFGTHTFLGESFPAFLDSLNALTSKLPVLIEATSGKGSSSFVIASFFSRNLSIPLLILLCLLLPQIRYLFY